MKPSETGIAEALMKVCDGSEYGVDRWMSGYKVSFTKPDPDLLNRALKALRTYGYSAERLGGMRLVVN